MVNVGEAACFVETDNDKWGVLTGMWLGILLEVYASEDRHYILLLFLMIKHLVS